VADQNQLTKIFENAVDLGFVAVFYIFVIHSTKTPHNQIAALPAESLCKLRRQGVVQVSEWFEQHTRNVERSLRRVVLLVQIEAQDVLDSVESTNVSEVLYPVTKSAKLVLASIDDSLVGHLRAVVCVVFQILAFEVTLRLVQHNSTVGVWDDLVACTLDFFTDRCRSFLVLIEKTEEAVGSATIAKDLVQGFHQFVVTLNHGAVWVN